MTKDNSKKIIQLSIAVLLVAVLGWTAIGLLFNATEYTVTTESFVGLNMTYVPLENTQPLIPSGESVYNSTSGIILPNGGTNYTMNNVDGSIMINTTSRYMVNNSEYTIQYYQGVVNSTVTTLGKLLVGLIFFIVVIIIILKEADIDIK